MLCVDRRAGWHLRQHLRRDAQVDRFGPPDPFPILGRLGLEDVDDAADYASPDRGSLGVTSPIRPQYLDSLAEVDDVVRGEVRRTVTTVITFTTCMFVQDVGARVVTVGAYVAGATVHRRLGSTVTAVRVVTASR